MISEAVIYRRLVNPNYQTRKGYLVYCLPVELEEDENNSQNMDAENIMKAVRNIQQKIEQQQIFIKNEISTKIDERMSRLEDKILGEISKLKTSAIILKE